MILSIHWTLSVHWSVYPSIFSESYLIRFIGTRTMSTDSPEGDGTRAGALRRSTMSADSSEGNGTRACALRCSTISADSSEAMSAVYALRVQRSRICFWLRLPRWTVRQDRSGSTRSCKQRLFLSPSPRIFNNELPNLKCLHDLHVIFTMATLLFIIWIK